jgi:purine-binding chemotaxis protein CheW
MSDCVLVRVGERRVAVPTARVREVAAVVVVTPVPQAPSLVVGLTQLRGQILPVLDLGRGGGRAPRPNDPLVVVELGPVRAALLVDHVLGVEPDPPAAELLDVGALFDELRAMVAS